MAAHAMDLARRNQEFETQKPGEILAWAVREFPGRIAVTSSFGPESGVLLHMLSRTDPAVPVLFLETGYHFPETLRYKEELVRLFGLRRVIDLKADPGRKAAVVKQYEGVPYEKNPDLCCQINKVEPLDLALPGYDAWVSGIRRHQTDVRKSIRIIEEYKKGEAELYKISPLANLTSREAWWYLKEHEIPKHPLYDKGYLSVGCWPCTRPVQEGDDERSGRWAGKAKTECGIHTFLEVKPPAKTGEKEPKEEKGQATGI